MDLPTVELIEGDFYWIRKARSDHWSVAEWRYDCWWDTNGADVKPTAISGPITRPAEPDVGSVYPKTEEL